MGAKLVPRRATALVPVADSAVAVSKRQANKADKLDRIKTAARELFISHGYDNTTTRQIAIHAEVALGTVFTYASNKRDLLFLVANDLLDATRERAQAQYRASRPLIESFVAFCSLYYQAFGTDPPLSRLILRELLFYDSGVQAVRAKQTRALLLANVETMIVDARRRREVDTAESDAFLAWVLFSVLQAELRRWLADDVQDLAEGLGRLWSSTALVINGVARRKVSARPTKATLRVLMASA